MNREDAVLERSAAQLFSAGKTMHGIAKAVKRVERSSGETRERSSELGEQVVR